jgi:sRNA-binding protein
MPTQLTQAQLFAEKKRLAEEKKKKKEAKAKEAAAAKAAAAANPQIEAPQRDPNCKCSACGLNLPCVKMAGAGAVQFQGRF